MSKFALPILGFDDGDPIIPSRVQWKDGTVVYRGILGAFDPEWEAEQKRKQELRSHENVVLMEDYR
jgi:hypothetical protein